MKLSRILLFSLLPLAAACAGSGSASRAIPQSYSAPFDSERQVGESYAQSEAATPVPASSALLYVGNTGSNSITVYHHDASGDAAPLKIIAGSKTGITSPGQLSEDAQGNLYVANAVPASVLVFPHGANGNVSPIRKLSVPLAGPPNRTSVYAAAVDPTTGKLFVSTFDFPSGSGKLMRFPPDANGNEAPYATLDFPYADLAFGSSGKTLIAFYPADASNVLDMGMAVFSKQFPSSSGVTDYHIAAFLAYGIADDPTTKTYLALGEDGAQQGIFRFHEDTDGVGEDEGPAYFTPPLVSVITSETCGTAVALGYLRNIYVVHSTNVANSSALPPLNNCPTDAIYVYEHDASGNAKPIRVLSGAATGLNQPYGIYEGK